MKRRDFFKYTSAAVFGSSLIRPSLRLAQKFIENAYGIENLNKDEQSRNYIQINLYGGPSRWGFDSLLRPYDDSRFIPNPLLGNSLRPVKDKSDEYLIEYGTQKQFGINFPPVWSEKLVGVNGSVEISELLKNILVIRGCRLNFDGHPLNGSQQVAPVVGEVSIHGHLADSSKAFFSAVSIGYNPVTRAFKSKHASLTEIPVSEKNYADYLLRPFLIEDSKRVFNQKDLEEDFNLLMSSYSNPSDLDLNQIKLSALKNLKSNIDQYVEEFSKYFSKYSLLVNAAIKKSEYPFQVRSPKLPLAVKGKKEIQDIIGKFLIEDKFVLTDDYFEYIKTGEINYWAQEFALCEFLIKNNLCQSILISPPQEIGNLFDKCKAKNVFVLSELEARFNSKKNQSVLKVKQNGKSEEINDQYFSMDSHKTGAVLEVLSTTTFYRVFLSCLNELISSLKNETSNGKNLFDETVIQVASEFDRRPYLNGYGSDHLPFSNVTSIFSGAIKGPLVIGDIYEGTLNKNRQEFYGTLGVGAPHKEIDGHITISHVSSTVSKILRISPVVKRAPALVEFDAKNEFHSILNKPKNIEGYV